MRGASGRRRRTGRRSRSTAASCCRRTATTTGRRSDATSSQSWPPSSPTELDALGSADARVRAAGGGELVRRPGARARRAESLLRHTRLLTLSGTGGVGQDAARARARPRRRAVLRGGRGDRRARARSRDARLVLDAVATALDVRALPGQELIDAVVDFLAPRALLARARQLRAPARGGDRRSRTRSCAPRRSSRSSRRAASRCACRARSCSASPRSTSRIPNDGCRRRSSLGTSPCCSSSSAPPRPLPASCSTRRTRRTSRGSVSGSTACRSRSSWPRAGSARSAPRRSPSGSTTASACCGRGSHAAPTRQQTLTATLQWSHDLLEPDERVLLPPARDASRAASSSRRSRSVCAGDELPAAEMADVLARLVEKSLVAVDEEQAATADTACSRPCACTRASGSTRPASSATLAGRHARWASALAERERESPRLDRDAANLRAALDTLLASEPREALRLCLALVAVLASADRSPRREAPLRRGARGRAGVHGAPRRGAASRRRRSTTAAARCRRGSCSRRRAWPSQREVGDARAEWRALQFLGEFGIAGDEMEVAMLVARARARARPPRGLRGARGARHLLARRRQLDPRRPGSRRRAGRGEHRALPGARGLARADPVAAQHRRRSA